MEILKLNAPCIYGEEIIVDGEDEMAKCFCHELEHLDGMIFLDKAIEELSVV